MALEDKGMTAIFKAESANWREVRAAALAGELYEEGILKSPTQRSFSGDDVYLAAFLWYCHKKLLSQEAKEGKSKGNCGCNGQAVDGGERMHMYCARGWSMDIADIPCRPAGTIDITVQCNKQAAALLEKSRQAVEIKTGAGTLVVAMSRDECYNVLADACARKKWIAWKFDMRNFHLDSPTVWRDMDLLPTIFLPIDHLMYYLQQYNGKIDTWLKFNGETCLNWQTVINSEKKLNFLYDLYSNESYDWVKFRDTGALVKLD